MNKTLFLDRLQFERDKFELLLNRVGFSRRMTIKGLYSSLSVKDLLADVLTREQFMADRLDEILHGVKYLPSPSHASLDEFRERHGFPDYESPLLAGERHNHLVIDKYRNIELDEIVSQELAAFSNILAAFEELSHDECLDHDLYHRIAEHTYRPYRRAAAEIRRWLKSIATETK